MQYLKYYIVLIILAVSTVSVFAQPVNDDCVDALEITISDNGFGLNTFTSTTIDITDATKQIGEAFHNSQISAGNDKKTVWFSFDLPTARAVNLELLQPTELISQNGAGFTVFKTDNCLPDLDAITDAKLTPVNKFGSTYNPCLLPGNYLVQVSAQNDSDGDIYLELTTDNPQVTSDYFSQATAYDFGTISGGWHTLNFDAGCQTIQDENETCPELGADYEDYTQSAWFVFTTDADVDMLSLRIGEQSGFFTGDFKVGYNIYEGDVNSTDYSGLPVIDGCQMFEQNSASDIPVRNYLCEFQPNTTYSIQVFFHAEYINSVFLELYERGNGNTLSPNPSALDPASELGLLPASASGEWTNGEDQLACNAFILDNACGTANPASGTVNVNGTNYDLSTWYRFEIDDYMNVRFVTSGYLAKRLFFGDIESDCNLAPIIEEFTNSDKTINCLQPGTYSVQLLGKVDTTQSHINSNHNNIGMDADLNLNVVTNNLSADFLLDAQGKVDSVNKISNVWEPLPNDIQVTATTGRFNCSKTVFPDAETCDADNNRALYREIIIGDATGDATPNEGVLTLNGGNYNFQYMFYQGSASALADAQNTYNWGETFTGLTPVINCTNLYHSRKVCVEPGNYTLVSFGQDQDVGSTDNPRFKFNIRETQFDSPSAPDDLGDITSSLQSGTVYGTPDYFSCNDNSQDIAGKSPCGNANKQIYRQFYIDQDLILNIGMSGGNSFRLFYGKITDGTSTLTSNIPGTGDIGCRSSHNTDVCNPLPSGWYTIVIYGEGGSYDGPDYDGGVIGNQTNISISKTEPLESTNYHAPYLAYDAGICDWGPNSNTTAIPVNSQSYTFGTEKFNCIDNAPLLVDNCGDYNRQAFYVFEITKESYLSFTGIPGSMEAQIFAADVRTDSSSFSSMTALQECINISNVGNYDRWWWTWYGKIDMCKIQPAVYTLVINANDSHINSTVTPTLYVDEVPDSRFDFAENAYDFDLVTADNTYHYGKTGDNNPLDPGRAPSNDFFSCTTGAFPDDPGQADAINYCWDGQYPESGQASVDYPMGDDFIQYNSTTNTPVRRNLWYTFVIDGPGLVSVKVENKTPGKSSQHPFAIYKSDADGTLDFSTLVGSGEVDSTLAQGLTFIDNNSTFGYYGCAGNQQKISFNIDPCDNPGKQRFYVVVDQHVGLIPASQVAVAVKYDQVASVESKYDHFIEANLINGLNEIDPPYTDVALTEGQYAGDMSSYACATQASTDQNSCGERTLWYKFESAVSGKLRIRYTIEDLGSFFNTDDILLFKETIPGDSTETGLEQIVPSSVNISGESWGESCLNNGTYYIMLSGCSYSIENVTPEIWLISEEGNNCSQAVEIDMNSLGTQSESVTIECHNIGNDFGEDGSNMGCLLGPDGYKSTWFRVDLNFTEKADITYQLIENTTALPYQIRYRVLYGSCNAMTAGPCNTDALTEFTLNCMMSENSSYYVQVVLPEDATGELELSVTATESPNQTCEPFDPLVPTANFTYENTCEGDITCFNNQSSLGDSLTYHWTFDLDDPGSDTSGEFEPCYEYPSAGTYDVQLIVNNTEFADAADTIVVPVTIYPKPNPDISRTPSDFEVTSGTSIDFFSNNSVTISDPPTSYSWDLSNGTSDLSDPVGVVYDSDNLGFNMIYLTVTNGTCVVTDSDSIMVGYEPIYSGGNYDGADIAFIEGVCPPEPIFAGGDYDGADVTWLEGSCPPEPIFGGGFYDGADVTWLEGICPPENIYAGGFYDGADVAWLEGNCPPEDIFAGGFYDGAAVSQLSADVTYTVQDDIICAGDNVNIQVNEGTSTVDSVIWHVNNTAEDTITAAPFDFVTSLSSDAVVSAVLYSPDVCDSTINDFNITVVNPPTADAGPDTTICTGDEVQIGTAPQPMVSYSWNPTGDLSDALSAQPQASPNTTTTYTLSVQDENAVCPASTDDITVNVDTDIPDINVDDGLICNGGTTELTVTGTESGDVINWYDDPTNSDIQAVMPDLPDASITASSEYDSDHAAYKARLNATYDPNWTAGSNDQNQWIKIDCGEVKNLHSIATQGRYGYDQWVTSYKVSYSNDDSNWTFIQDGGSDKIFTGNSDRHTVVTHVFDDIISARYIRVHPWDWNSYISMRMEVYEKTVLGTNTDLTVSEAGVYYVVAERGICSDTDSATVVHADHSAGDDTGICEVGGSVQIGDTAMDGFTYAWSPADYLSATDVAQPTSTPVNDITYNLTVTNAVGSCTDEVDVYAPISVDAGSDIELCPGDNIEVTPAYTGTVNDWVWSSGDEGYIQPVEITNYGSEETNYKIKLVINTAELISNGKMLNDCGDLRVYNESLNAEYDYWIADGTCNTTATEIWVEIPLLESALSLNIATGGTASASSEYGSDFASKAFDGSISDGWGSDNTSAPWFLQYDYGTGNSENVNAIKMYLSSSQSGGWGGQTYDPKTWEFQGSNDASSWVTLYDHDETLIQDVWHTFIFDNAVDYQYYRVYITATNGSGYYCKITELEFYNLDQTAMETLNITYGDPSLTTTAQGTDVSTFVDDFNGSITYLDELVDVLSNTQSYTIDQEGTYTVTASNASCSVSDTIEAVNLTSLGDLLAWRSRTSGNWTTTETWQVWDGSSWIDAETYLDACGNTLTYPDYQDSTILIQASHTVNFDLNAAVDEFTTESGAVLNIPSGQTFEMVDSSASPIAEDVSNQGQIIIQDGGELSGIGDALLRNEGRIDISGTFNVAGGATPALVNNDLSTVAYNNGNQTMWDGAYGRIETNGGGIKTLGGSMTRVNTEVEFIDGKIELGMRNITFAQEAVTTNASYSNGYFITASLGSVIKENLGNGVYTSFLFPVGHSNSSYNPAMLTNTGVPDNIRCRVVGSFDYEDAFATDELSEISSVNRTWYISEGVAGESDIELDLYWESSHENVDFNAADCQNGYYNTGSGWEYIGLSGAAAGSGTWADMHSQTASGINNLFAFGVGSCSQAPDTYRTIADGNWTDINIWEVFDGTDWVSPQIYPTACGEITYPTSNSNDIIVRHEVEYDYSIPQGIDQTTLENTASLHVPESVNLLVVNGAGDDLINQGYLRITGTADIEAGAQMDNQAGSTVHYDGESQYMLACTYASLIVEGAAPNAADLKFIDGAEAGVYEHLYFNNAKIQLDDANFDVTNASVIHDYSENNGYFVANGDGYLNMEFPTGTSVQKEFPVGGSMYSPASITFDNVTSQGYMQCHIREQIHPSNPNTIQRYWNFEQQSLSFTGSYEMDLHYLEEDLAYIPSTALEEMSLTELGGAYNTAYATTDNWIYMEVGSNYSVDVNNNLASIVHDQFSDFTIMSKENSLPVTWLYINAAWKENDARIQWATASELNCDGFELQRRMDNQAEFEKIGFIDGAGNSNEVNQYSFIDENAKNLQATDYYYRVKQIDYDGNYSFSEIVVLHADTSMDHAVKPMLTAMYPNPVNKGDVIHLLIESEKQQLVSLSICDMPGKVVKTEKRAIIDGSNHIILDTESISEGAYVLMIKSGQHTESHKLIITRER